MYYNGQTAKCRLFTKNFSPGEVLSLTERIGVIFDTMILFLKKVANYLEVWVFYATRTYRALSYYLSLSISILACLFSANYPAVPFKITEAYLIPPLPLPKVCGREGYVYAVTKL